MARDRESYEAVLQAVGVCVAARIPFLLWGDPGAGKTAVIESAAGSGWHVETLICSHYEPSDFAGLPVVNGDRVTLAPPGWAVRVSEEPKPSIVFFDEWTTASPAVQAAALRPLTHAQVGVLQLPDRVSFGAAANPADVAASGWELAPPTANRFVHLEWSLPLDVYTESIVTGDWPVLPVPERPADLDGLASAQRSLVAGFDPEGFGRPRAGVPDTTDVGLRGAVVGDRGACRCRRGGAAVAGVRGGGCAGGP